jgi:hypothetical protein
MMEPAKLSDWIFDFLLWERAVSVRRAWETMGSIVQFDDPEKDVERHDTELALVRFVRGGEEEELDEGSEVGSEQRRLLRGQVLSVIVLQDRRLVLTESVKPSRTSKTCFADTSSLASRTWEMTATIPGTRAWKAAWKPSR